RVISSAPANQDSATGRGGYSLGRTLHEMRATPTSPMPSRVNVDVKLSLPGRLVAARRSVIATNRFGSAPWSPEALTVDVIPKIVAVPSPLSRPVILRRPSVAVGK